MESESHKTEFWKHIHDEKLRTIEARSEYTLRKMAYTTGLLGLGSLNVKVGDIDFSLLVYLAPWVAIAFDFYIMGEDYSVKRIGTFLKTESIDSLEKQWEQWVAKNRDPFAPLATQILTTLILIGSAIIAYQQPGASQSPLFKIWLAVSGLSSWLSFILYRRLRRRVLRSVPRVGKQSPSLQRLTTLVDNTDYQLTKTVCREISEFFTVCLSSPSYLHGIQQLTSEYGKQEFLLCVDRQGQPLSIDDETIEIFRETVARYPEYKFWFREDILSKNGKPTLLIARWLCHLLGFRHIAVHLFIDHPTLTDHTLVQVRATDKAESPGCFDLPVAGHVVGTESVEKTLSKELAEELGLEIDMLHGLTQLSSYEYRQISDSLNFRNVEYRVVFSSRLNHDGWIEKRETDHEVAAIAVFSIIEMQKVMVDFPERVASGLKASFSLYLESKLKV